MSADADVPREMIGFAAEHLMELEVGAKIDDGYGAKSAERLARRNDYRDQGWQTRAGSVELRIPRQLVVLPCGRRAHAADFDHARALISSYPSGLRYPSAECRRFAL